MRKSKDFSGVVVWLEPLKGPVSLPAPAVHTMLQKGKKFIPQVMVIPTGATVNFPNADPIFHNAFSNFSGQPFDTGLYAPGTSQKVTFRREGIVRVFCNIHSTMSAVIVVVRTPHFARTGRDGSFRMESVPPGEYQLKIWHERASEEKLKALERTITVGAEDIALPVVSISESGYLEVPHLNKCGKEYPEREPDHVIYPGGRK